MASYPAIHQSHLVSSISISFCPKTPDLRTPSNSLKHITLLNIVIKSGEYKLSLSVCKLKVQTVDDY